MEILIVEDLIDVVPEGDFAPSTKTSMSNLTGCFTFLEIMGSDIQLHYYILQKNGCPPICPDS